VCDDGYVRFRALHGGLGRPWPAASVLQGEACGRMQALDGLARAREATQSVLRTPQCTRLNM
jgi:hypothetical protein